MADGAAAVVFGDGARNRPIAKQQRSRSLSRSRSPPRKAEQSEEGDAGAIDNDEEVDMTSPEEVSDGHRLYQQRHSFHHSLTLQQQHTLTFSNGLQRLTALSVRCIEFEQNEKYAELVTARIHSLALTQLCFGKYDEEVTLAYCRLARAYLRQRLYSQAEAHAMHALERLAGSSHDNADEIRVSTLSTLGQAHVGQRKYNRAQPLLSEALTLQQRLIDLMNGDGDGDGDGGSADAAAAAATAATGATRPSEYALNELCEILQTLSIVATHKKQYEEAVEWLERMWEARESALGPNHVSLLGIYVRLGRAYLSLDASSGADRAANVFKRAIAVALASDTGVTTHDVGSALFGLGSAMLLLDRHNEALPHLERSLKIFKTVHGAKCVHVQRVLRQMALVHVKNKSYAVSVVEDRTYISQCTHGWSTGRREVSAGLCEGRAPLAQSELAATGRDAEHTR